MKDIFSLEGKTAIVTGGNRGIGKGICQGFASVGCNLVIAARDTGKIKETAEEIRGEYGVEVLGVSADVQYEEQIQSMIDETLDAFDGINILVNNAGINIRKMPQEYDVSEWDHVLDINLRAAFLCSKAVFPSMKVCGGGKVINIGSMTSIFGGAKLAPYGTSKGGIVQLTRSLAVAWAKDNIQVNAILPGWIDTDLTRQARIDIPELNDRVLTRTPMGRWGYPVDLAGSAIFLASSASDFLTGVALPVDGGYSVFL
jgi:2-deoxy-D-gluconate 3-dehydrogenase